MGIGCPSGTDEGFVGIFHGLDSHSQHKVSGNRIRYLTAKRVKKEYNKNKYNNVMSDMSLSKKPTLI